MAASVIVCTYRRLELLERCLYGCARQILPPGQEFEVVVVDNGCAAEVAALVASMAASPKSTGDFRYVAQEVLGLTRSRNVGVRRARGEIVVFLDDDAMPVGTGWLAAYLARFGDRRVGAVGGPIIPEFEGGVRPTWLSRHVEAKYSVLDVAVASDARRRRRFPFRSRLRPMGANVAFRSSLVPSFDERTSRVGSSLVSRDELPALRAVEAVGARVWLDPAAAVVHRIPRERLSPTWVQRRFEAEGRSRVGDRLAGGAGVWIAGLQGVGHAVVTTVLALLIPLTTEPGRRLAVHCRLTEARSELMASLRMLGEIGLVRRPAR